MNQKLQNHKIEFENRLNDYINNVPEFLNPKVRHHKFLSYDQTEQEEPLYEFWRDTVHSLINNVFQTTYATPDQILKWFQIEGKKPMGLANVLSEMKLRKEFISKAEVLDQSYYNEKGSFSNIFSKALSFFSSSKSEELNMNEELISATWLEDLWTSITKWTFTNNKQLFHISEIKTVLKNSGCSRDDVDIVLIHLRKTDRMIGDDYVKIGDKGKVEQITNVELTEVRLNSTAKDLEKRISDVQDKILVTKENAKNALKNKDKVKATSFCREKKGLERIEASLRGMQMKIEKTIIDLNIQLQTKDTLDVLKLSTVEQTIADEDIEEAEDLMDKLAEQNYNMSKISEMFTNDQDEEVDDEELLKELELSDSKEYNENDVKDLIGELDDEAGDQKVNEFECSHVTPEKVYDKYKQKEEHKVVFA